MVTSFEIIKEDALSKLNEAKGISATASTAMDGIGDALEAQDNELARIEFINEAIKELLLMFNKFKTNIDLQIKQYNLQKDELINDVLSHLGGLNQIRSEMMNTKVDPNLNDKEKVLFDFIDEQSIDQLTDNISLCIEKMNKIPNTTFTDSVIMRFYNGEKYLLQEWETIQNSYEKQMNPQIRDEQIQMLLQNNSALEVDLVELLQGLNEHWDKCILYKRTPSVELLQILEEDYDKLPSVLVMLKKNSSIILQNCKDITRYLAAFGTIKNKMLLFLKEIQEFNDNVITKQVENDLFIEWRELDNQFLIMRSYKDEVIGYQTDCTLFMSSYYKLILELERRRIFNSNIQSMIKEFETKMRVYTEDDAKERIQFMKDNADFIPQDLIRGTVITSSTPQIQVSYEQEIIPKISSNAIKDAKKKVSL